MLRLKVALVFVIAASAGLITLQGDVSLVSTVAAACGGGAVGAVLVWYVFPGGDREVWGRRGRR